MSLNFSNRRNPQADSGVQFQKELIRAVLRKRDDFYFYLLVPEELASTYAEEFNTKKIVLIPTKLSPWLGLAIKCRHLQLHN